MAPGRACLLASWWLLREIEASHARVPQVCLDWSKKRADLNLPNSKTDLMALGTSRAHTCSCKVSDAHLCPFHSMAAQVAFATSVPGNHGQWLFPTSQGQKPTKQGWVCTFTEMAKQLGLETHWDNGAPRHTGHSARASGACHLAQAGVDLWRIQVFGRWSSNAFLKYVRSSPLASLCSLATETAISSSIAAAKHELRALTSHTEKLLEDPAKVVPVSSEMLEDSAPQQVPPRSTREFVSNATPGGKVHEILLKGDGFHPREWRTFCGWYFGRGLTNYSIVPQIPSGQRCRICFRDEPQPDGSGSSSSDSSSSSA